MPRLTIVTALMAEAAPIIDHYRLKKRPKRPGFHAFRSDDINLIVCGIGADNTKRGIEHYIHELEDALPETWLNVGVAGALSISIGALVWADTVGGESISCPISVNNHPKINIVSLAEPSINYQPNVLFDMEAQSCLQMIKQISSQRARTRLFCAKVISDNRFENSHKIDKHWVAKALIKKMRLLSIEIDKLI